MKLKLITMVILALVVCATVPMAATAAPTATTALSVWPPAAAYTVGSFDITGMLSTGTATTGVKDRLVTVYASPDGKKWTALGTDWTDGNGLYTVTTSQKTVGTYYYKATFAGDRVFKKVTSPTITVTVSAPPPPTAAFTADVQSGHAPLKVQFTDKSTGIGPLTYKWDFGDGQTSTDQNPSYTYTSAPATYVVKLTVTGPGGSDDETMTITVAVPLPPTLISPVDGATFPSAGSDNILFESSALEGASTYWFRFEKYDGTTWREVGGIATSPGQPPSGMWMDGFEAGQWRWHVKALHTNDGYWETDYGAYNYFTVTS